MDGNFHAHCHYIGWDTFLITKSGFYNGYLYWLGANPVVIYASNVPGKPSITSASTVNLETGSDLNYTIQVADNKLPLTYNAPDNLPANFTYNA